MAGAIFPSDNVDPPDAPRRPPWAFRRPRSRPLLREHVATRLLQLPAARKTVTSHARHDHRQCHTVDRGNRTAEQVIDGRSDAVLGRIVSDADPQTLPSRQQASFDARQEQ